MITSLSAVESSVAKELSVIMKKRKDSPARSTITRRMTTGEHRDSQMQTPPAKMRSVRMKAQNNSRKKIVKMTEKETEDIKKTTADIRKFFEGKTTLRKTTLKPKVSHSPDITNLNTLSGVKCGEGRHPAASRLEKSGLDDGGGLVTVTDGRGGRGTLRMTLPGNKCEEGGCRDELSPGNKPGRGGATRTEQKGGALRQDDEVHVCGLHDVGRGGGAGTRGMPDDGMSAGISVDGAGERNNVCNANVCNVRGHVEVITDCIQSDVDICDPGSQRGDIGASIDGGGAGIGRGDGGEGGSSITSLKTKPNRVSGGLLAKIHLWERKSGGVIDENLEGKSMKSSISSDRQQVRSNSDRKWITATLGEAWPGQKQRKVFK